jgi:hypothetical protein
MGNFYNWEDVLKVEGIKNAVLKFAISPSEFDDYKGYLNDDGSLPEDEGTLQYLFEAAIKQGGECVFYFCNDGKEQISDHFHIKFQGKYFEFDGNDMITGPLDYNHAEGMIDLCEYHLGDDEPRDGYLVSIGGEFPDEYFTQRCLKLVKIGHELEINNNKYIRTMEGFVLKK